MSKKDKNEEIEHDEFDLDVNESAQTDELSVEEQLKEELGKEKDKFLRLFAEFENYKRRTAKERIDLFKIKRKRIVERGRIDKQ